MSKKLRLLLPTAAVLLFAVPSAAHATTGLTEGGSLIATGFPIAFTNSGSIVTTSTKTGNITCKSVRFETILTTNTTSEVHASLPFGSGFVSECSVPSGASVSAPIFELSELRTVGESLGSTKRASFNVSYQVKIGALTCNYSTAFREATYTPGGHEIVISEQPVTVFPIACGTTAKLDGKFKISTSSGTALTLD